ncbi:MULTISPECIES: hypothetical protein [unclassified Streptomyces]|nr:hypothetical protein [Streptomyces sp. CB02058]
MPHPAGPGVTGRHGRLLAGGVDHVVVKPGPRRGDVVVPGSAKG